MKKIPGSVTLLFALTVLSAVALAESAAIVPKFLLSAAERGRTCVTCDRSVSFAADGGRHVMAVAPGDAAWPAVTLAPESGVWDLSAWGHVEVELRNPGREPLSVGLRVDNAGDWKKQPWNAENIYLKPGETKIGKVIFGYGYGFQKGFKLDPSRVTSVKIFLNGKKPYERKLMVGDVTAAGAAGEKPPVDPNRMVVVPKDGVIPGTPLKVALDGKRKFVPLKPKSGYWNLGGWLKVVAKVRNTGGAAVTPRLVIDANGEKISGQTAKALAPGESATIEIPFVPATPWFAKGDGRDVKPVGGTKFESHRVRGFNFTALESAGTYEVVSVKAEKVVARQPPGLGRRPPVEGKWTLTLSEEFNGKTLDEQVWSPYASNFWDKRTHFTKDNLIFRDGKCILRYERKTGPKNDDPALGTTDYACGILNSFGRWTQLYGYFEARMKLPTAPGLWPAFWTMPDRGPAAGKEHWMRADTKKHGMEFDIMEHLTAWGPCRFNVACHWDGYGKDHRAIGSSGIYVEPDAEGFITVGMLWLPGVWAIYGNGRELARWESERVSNVPAHIFFYMVSGGWANEPLDDDRLPAEFAIDWLRVWQRDDLRK